MKVILYCAISINGFIADEKDDTLFLQSPESWENMKKVFSKGECVITGRRTYDVMETAQVQFEALTVVMTHKPELVKGKAGILVTNQKPTEILQEMSNKGFETVYVCGGGQINSAFINQKLVNEILLDVEPYLLDKGIPLFQDLQIRTQLELIDSTKLNTQTVQQRYKVMYT